MEQAATIAPITTTVTLGCSPGRAFEVFTKQFGEWWPIREYSIGRESSENAVFEGWEGGRVYEVHSGGQEAMWARVMVWDPPSRLELEWQTNPEAPGPTHVTVTFTPEGSGTRVDLEHRGWEIYGDRASVARSEYDNGWPGTLGRFAGFGERGGLVEGGMFVHLAIHRPKPDMAETMLESMNRFGKAMEAGTGLVLHAALRDERSDRLVGLAIWESREAWEASIEKAREAIAGDDIDSLLQEAPDVFLLAKG